MGATARRRMLAATLTTVLAAGIAPSISAATAPSAVAATTASPTMGPIDPNTGYPFWYQDSSGQKLSLCIDRSGDALCLSDLPDKTRRPWIDEDPTLSNFDPAGEVFWSNATAKIAQGTKATFVASREGAFGGPALQERAGDQIGFGRIRIRASNLVPGATYTVTHPYGTKTFVAEDSDGSAATPHDGVINDTQDIGGFDLPCDFTRSEQSAVSSFLRWSPNGAAAPAGYVGDPGVDHTVVGSPVGTNFFRIDGPDAGGNGVNTVTTDLFSVQGKQWQPTAPMLGIVGTRNTVDLGRSLYVAPAPGATTTAPTTPAVQQTLTLTNAGGGATPLTMGQLQVTGADASAFTILSNGCQVALAPGQTCDVQIGFTPQHQGNATARLEVTDNGADSTAPAFAAQRILLRGNGMGTNKDARVQGPISLQNGYPLWYQDEAGTKLALCDDPNDQMCLQPFAGPYDPAVGPMSLRSGNFPQEMFWWSGDARMATNSGFDARLVMGQEAAFVNGAPVVGDQIAFGRLRLRIGGLTDGAQYTVTTPYGQYHFTGKSGSRGINYTEDIGCLESPCDFSRINQSNIGPFLKTANAPATGGYVADPNADSTVLNGPSGNMFRIDGPNIGGPGVDSVQTDQFTVSGKLWTPPAKGTLALQDTQSTVQVPVGSTRTLTLVNVGAQPAKVGRLSLPLGSAFSIASDTCSGATVAVDGTCTVGVSLPANAATTAKDFLTVPDGSTATPGWVLLNGASAVVGGGGTVTPPAPTPAGPSVPDLVAADDTGYSNADNITNKTRVTFTGVGTAAAPVTLKVDGATPPKQPVTADAGGVWTATLDLKTGTHAVTASYADGTTSAPLTVVVDQTRPGVPQSLTLDPKSDTGTPGDGITTNRTPMITGTAPTDAHHVELFANGALVGSAVQTNGAWAVTTSQLPVGKLDFRARSVDAAGNASGQAGTLKVTVQLAAPAALAVAGTGVTPLGAVTNVAQPTVTGTTAPAALVQVLVDGAVAGQTQAAPTTGRFAVTVPRLAAGTHTVGARAVNGLGRPLSVAARFRLRVDLSAPVVTAPSVRPVRHLRLARRLPRMVPNVVSWSGRDTGAGVASYRLQVSRNGAPFADVALPKAQATHVQQALRTGVGYVYRVRATDRAGNVSAWQRVAQVRPELVQQSSSLVDYVGSWIRKAAEFASGKSLRFARRDAAATLTTRAQSVTWVTSTGPQRGLAAVLVNGHRVRTVDLYSPHGSHRLLLVTVDGLPADRLSQVEIRALGDKRARSTNTRVDVDAFIVQR